METLRRVIAVLAAILVIILLVLLARWAGDRIREKFLVVKTPATVTPATNKAANKDQTPSDSLIPSEKTNPQVNQVNQVKNTTVAKTATYSAIPSTGPADFGYFLIGLFFISGVSVSALAKRFS